VKHLKTENAKRSLPHSSCICTCFETSLARNAVDEFLKYLEEISLGVRAHCSTSDANNESRERVKATTVAWGLRSFSWANSGCSRRCKPAANTPGLDSHPNESSKPKHDLDNCENTNKWEESDVQRCLCAVLAW
jgi:hypothetical protein